MTVEEQEWCDKLDALRESLEEKYSMSEDLAGKYNDEHVEGIGALALFAFSFNFSISFWPEGENYCAEVRNNKILQTENFVDTNLNLLMAKTLVYMAESGEKNGNFDKHKRVK